MPPLVHKYKLVFLSVLSIVALLFAVACNGLSAPFSPAPGFTPGDPTTTSGAVPQKDRWAGSPDTETRFEHLTLEQGLSQSVVLAVLQDSQGFMWFGTQDGLNRYDGYGFVVYKHDPQDDSTLSSNFIWVLHQDRSGMIWIGTNGGGLDSFDPTTGRFTHYRNDPNDPHSLSSNIVLSIYEDPAGVLWIGTDGGGLNRLDRETGTFEVYRSDPGDPHSLSCDTIQVIAHDDLGLMWLGTAGGGLNRFDPAMGRADHWVHDPDDPRSLANDDVCAAFEDRQGELWVGTNGGGLARFDRETERFIHYKHDPGDPHSLSNDQVWSVFEDSGGALWLGTFGGGLERFDRETGRFVHHQSDPGNPHSLSNDQIWSIYQDGTGALWFGTFGGGVNRLDWQRIKFRHYQVDPQDPMGLSDNVVWSILEDREGVLWIGTNGGGLNKREPGGFIHYTHVPADDHSLGGDIVWSLLEDTAGGLWLGTNAGLDKFDRDTGQALHYPSKPVFTIHQDWDGLLWFGTWGGGLGRLDPETGQMIFHENDPADSHSLADNTVVAIHQDQEDVLWLGTFDEGLDRLDLETGRFAHFRSDPQDPHSLSHNTVLAIHRDRQGVLWVATGGGGLNRFDPATETFVHYTEKDGLPNDTVYGILEDDLPAAQGGPNLWLSTNRGLSRFNPQTETFRNYDVGDGLQSHEFNQGSYYLSPGGEMFFGGVNGFNAFYPEEAQDNSYVPPVVLTSLTQGGEELDTGTSVESLTSVRLPWPRNFFEFSFAALNFTQPEENQHAYMLDGFDAGWVEAGANRFGRYTNLPGGTYTLRLRGSNNDGVWNEGGHAVEITIVPPFWQTWWFRGVALLLVLGLVVAGYTLRVRSVEARSRALETQVAHRTRELAALNAVASAASRSLDLQEILDDALVATLQVTDTEGGGIYLVDERTNRLRIAAHRGFSPEFIAGIDGLGVGEGFSGQVVQTGQPLIVQDIAADERLTRRAVRESGFHTLICVPLSSKGKVLGTLFALTGGYCEFSEQDVQLLTSISHQIGAALENAQLYEVERRRADELDALRTTMADITAELELTALLQAIVERAAGLLDATGGEFGLYDEARHELEVTASYNLGQDYVGTRHKLGEGAMGRVAESGEALIVEDYQTWEGGLSAYSQVHATLAAPLKVGDRLVGVFTTVTVDPDRRFDAADLRLLNLFAQQAAIAIENARLYEQAQQLAVMEERQRLARDLHDSVTQSLYGMMLYSEAAGEELSLDQLDTVAEYLRELQQTAREALAEMRLLIHELRPTVLTEEGLVAALQARLLAVEGRAGLQTKLTVDVEDRLPPKIEEELYRIAQEALNNALKHAQASVIAVSLQYTVREERVTLEIIDDGLGLDPAAARAKGGMGLAAMEERAQAHGGRFSVESGPQGGTRVTVEVPT